MPVAREGGPCWNSRTAPRIPSGIRDATSPWSYVPRFRILLNGFEHPRVREATTEHAGERLSDLVVGRLGISVEKRFRAEDHAAQTKAALRRFFVDEGLLNGMRFRGCAQAFQGQNLCVLHFTHGRDAGAHSMPVHRS